MPMAGVHPVPPSPAPPELEPEPDPELDPEPDPELEPLDPLDGLTPLDEPVGDPDDPLEVPPEIPEDEDDAGPEEPLPEEPPESVPDDPELAPPPKPGPGGDVELHAATNVATKTDFAHHRRTFRLCIITQMTRGEASRTRIGRCACDALEMGQRVIFLRGWYFAVQQ